MIGEGEDSPLASARESLAQALQPPKDMAVTQAYKHLLHLGALKFPEGSDELDISSDDYASLDEDAFASDEELDSDEASDSDSEGESPKKGSSAKPDLDDTKVTYLGRFLSGLPIDMELGKMIALGALCGDLLGHVIVMAAGISMQEVFILPHPRLITDRQRYKDFVARTQRGRAHFDCGNHSDPIATIPLFAEYVR